MKTTDLFQSILLFALFLCGLTACNDSDEIRLSPFQETTVKGEASTLQIDLTRGDWRITSITTPWGDLMMDGNKLPQLEGTGSLHYKWWDLERDTDSHLILHFKDNFDLGESRSLIINLEMKTGLYKEQIIIHQEPCTNFYQIESIEYSVEEGDGVKEAGTGPDKSTYKNENLGNTTDKHDYYPFINNYLDWSRNSSSYTSMKYENQHKVNLGGSYITKPRLARSTELMGGIGFGNSYINLKGGKMQYLEASVGASFPIRYSYLSLGATWRKQLNTRSNLMQESRFSLNLNLTFGERISRAKLK